MVKNMRQTRVAMRLPSDLVRAVDTFAKDETAKTGVQYTRTDAIRRLLTLSLVQLGRLKK
jgi:predicted DNA binding CopG/RHH family protein